MIKPHIRLRCTFAPHGLLMWWAEVRIDGQVFATRMHIVPGAVIRELARRYF
jgi:hypothetical protein